MIEEVLKKKYLNYSWSVYFCIQRETVYERTYKRRIKRSREAEKQGSREAVTENLEAAKSVVK